MSTGQIKKFLRSTISDNQPPVHIQGGLIGEAPDFAYVETREAVRESMSELLNNWVPPNQKTTAPQHLSTGLEADEADLPQFIREWMLADIKAGGTHQEAFTDPSHSWSDVQYDPDMQRWVDSQVNTGVAPGFGGIPQELWIAAPDVIRERERLIMNTILQTGIVPEILNHRQMVFLPKSPQATGALATDYSTKLISYQAIYSDQRIFGASGAKSPDAARVSEGSECPGCCPRDDTSTGPR